MMMRGGLLSSQMIRAVRFWDFKVGFGFGSVSGKNRGFGFGFGFP